MQLETIAGIAGGMTIVMLSKNLNTIIVLLNLNSFIFGRIILNPIKASENVIAKKIWDSLANENYIFFGYKISLIKLPLVV